MFAKNEDVAFPCDRDSAGFGRKRPWFVRRRIVAKQYLIDLGRAETGNLDLRLFDDELLELDFEILKAPGAVFAQPVEGDAQQALLGAGQMPDANAGNSGKPQLLSGLDANCAIEDGVAAPDQHGVAKAELGDRGGDFANMSRFLTPHLARRAGEIGRGYLLDRQSGQKIVAPPQRRSGRQRRKTLAAALALSLQLRSESRRLVGDFIEGGHFYPLSSEAAGGVGVRRIGSFRAAG